MLLSLKKEIKKENLTLLLFTTRKQTKTTAEYNSLCFTIYVDMLSGSCSE